MKNRIELFANQSTPLENVKGGKKKIGRDCCQDGKTVDFYSHNVLGIKWTSTEVVGDKDDCA